MRLEEQNNLKKFSQYFKESLSFYALVQDTFVKICFVIILFTILGTLYIPAGLVRWQVFSLYFLAFSIITLVSSAYLIANIKELRGKEYTIAMCIGRIKKKAGLLIVSSFLFSSLVLIGSMMFILPGVYIISIYFLHNCYIVDLGESVQDSFEASRRLTRTLRYPLFKYFLNFVIIGSISVYFLLSAIASSGSELLISVAFSFFSAMLILIYHRMVAYLYYDIEYKKVTQK